MAEPLTDADQRTLRTAAAGAVGGFSEAEVAARDKIREALTGADHTP